MMKYEPATDEMPVNRQSLIKTIRQDMEAAMDAQEATPRRLRPGGYAQEATPRRLRPGGYAQEATPRRLRPGGYAQEATPRSPERAPEPSIGFSYDYQTDSPPTI